MTTAPFTQASNTSVAVGIAVFLGNLLKQGAVSRSLQKANAVRVFTNLNQRLIAGQLKVREVEEVRRSTGGKTFERLPHGRAVLSLFEGVSHLQEVNWQKAAKAVSPALKDNLTKLFAQFVMAIVLEHQGDAEGADRYIASVSARTDLTEKLCICLVAVNIDYGLQALAGDDSFSLELRLDRMIALDRTAKELGLEEVADSAFAMTRAWLVGNSETFASYMDDAMLDAETKRSVNNGIATYSGTVDSQSQEQILEYLEELQEGVRLLAIRDPFDRWGELSRLVGYDWPEGLTAEEAIRQERA